MDPLVISYEWSVPVTQDDETTIMLTSMVVRMTEAQVNDYLSKYTPGSPVDQADASAFFTTFMTTLYNAQSS